jgi:hypothetical protein
MQKYGYISKGYVLHNEIAETEITPPVSYKYRPMNCVELTTVQHKANKLSEGSVSDELGLFFDLIQSQLVEWDLKKVDENGIESVVDFKNRDELKNISSFIINSIGIAILTTGKMIETPKEKLLNAVRVQNTIIRDMIDKQNARIPESEQTEYELFVLSVLAENPTINDQLKN